jgi:imidazolonepropionase-like amidohydrolase
MSKPTAYGALFLLMGVLLITGCAATPEEAPTTAVSTQVAVDSEPATQIPQTSHHPESRLVFRNGLVVTVTGEDPIPGGVVVVEDGLITAIGPESDVTIPEDAIVIDLEGRTILPGLIDARASALLKNLKIEDGQIENLYASVYLKKPLATGVTTLRATGWTWEEMQATSELRKALEVCGNTIPTMVIAGASLAHSEGPAFTKHYPDQTVGVGTVEEARQRTEEIIELGADQVNFLMSSGPSLSESPEEREPLLTLEMLKAVVETAHAQDTLVVGQALFPEEALTAIEAGVDELTAWPSLSEPLPDDLLEAIISNSIPVLSGFSVGMPQEGDVRRFLDAGGTLVYGTFAPNSGASPDREFSLMELQGMTPLEMIQSATLNAAYAVGLGDVVGSLEVGKQADIIVVDGNPFEDDFKSVFRNVVYVVNNGEIVVQPEE